MKIASLDLGSNTFLMLVAEIENGSIKKTVRDELRVTRLAEGVHATKMLQPHALKRADDCLREYAEILAHEKPDKVVAMATSAARDALNGEELFKIGRRHGIDIQIIPGAMEAKISFLGSAFEYADKENILTIDIGGGSTEVVLGLPDDDVVGISLNIGSVRLTELFVTEHPVPKAQVENVQNYVRNELKLLKDFNGRDIKEMVAVAGTATTLAAVAQAQPYSSKLVHGYKLSVGELSRLRDELAHMDLETRKAKSGMDAKRADVIVAGSTILLELAQHFGLQNLTVSDRGVRYGIALMAEKGAL